MNDRDNDIKIAPMIKDVEEKYPIFSKYYYDLVNYSNAVNAVKKDDNSDRAKKDEESDSMNNSEKSKEVDVVIIVAVPNEKDGVYSAFGLSRTLPRKFDLLEEYRFDYVQFEHSDLKIALLIQPNMGMTQSSSLTTRAILGLKPKLVAMVGICAGRKDKTQLGDIIIASNVFDYTAGKQYIDRFGPRPRSYPIDDSLAGYIVGSVVDNHELIGKIVDGYQGEKPNHQISIQFKPLASGTAVIDDPQIIQELAKTQDDLVGIDMEAYALAVSSNILRTKWVVVKTVQDFADGDKSKTESGIRTFAAYSSAKLLELVLGDLSNYL